MLPCSDESEKRCTFGYALPPPFAGSRRCPLKTVLDVVHAIPLPPAVSTQERTALLTSRERRILEDVAIIFAASGFAHLTMGGLAGAVRCSLRDIYRIASTKEDLFLLVIDRLAFAHGRAAALAITEDMDCLEAVRTYLRVGNEMVDHYGQRLSADIAADARMTARLDLFATHGINVVKALLDHAVYTGELRPFETGALARMLAGTARDFTRREATRVIGASPTHAANEMVDLVCACLRPQLRAPRP